MPAASRPHIEITRTLQLMDTEGLDGWAARHLALASLVGFEHSYLGYQKGCGCSICRADNNRIQRIHREQRKRRPLSPIDRARNKLVDAAPVREHLAALMARNPDFPHIQSYADAAGLSPRTLLDLTKQQTARVQKATADAITGITDESLRAKSARLPARWVNQRIRSMQAQGWSLSWQAEQLGLLHPRPQYERMTEVTREVFDRVDELYRRVGDRQGPSKRATLLATRLGWHPAIFYDEESHLIRDAIPMHREQRLRDRAERARTICEGLRLSCRGFSAGDIADQLGVTKRQVQRWRTAAGLYGDPDRAAEVLREIEAAETAEGLTYDEVLVELGVMVALNRPRDAKDAAA